MTQSLSACIARISASMPEATEAIVAQPDRTLSNVDDMIRLGNVMPLECAAVEMTRDERDGCNIFVTWRLGLSRGACNIPATQ